MSHYDYERAFVAAPDIDGEELRILFILNMRTNKGLVRDGVWQVPDAYMPTQDELAAEARMSVRTVRRRLDTLAAKKWIRVKAATPGQRRAGIPDQYILLAPPPAPNDESATDTGHGDRSTPVTGTAGTPVTGTAAYRHQYRHQDHTSLTATAPRAATGIDLDRETARDEITALAGEARSEAEAAWRERLIDVALRPDVEFDVITLAGQMLARGESTVVIERTIEARHRDYQAAR